MRLEVRRGFGRDVDCVGVQVEADEFDGNMAALAPAFNAAQRVSVAATNIENAQRRGERRQISGELVEPLEQGTIREGEAVGAGDVLKAVAEHIAAAGRIHQLGELSAAG